MKPFPWSRNNNTSNKKKKKNRKSLLYSYFTRAATKEMYVGERSNLYPQYDFPQCIKLPAPKKRPKIAALPSVVCPICLIFNSPGTCMQINALIYRNAALYHKGTLYFYDNVYKNQHKGFRM